MQFIYAIRPRGASRRADPTFDPDQWHRANFARQATIDAFGHHGRALDQANFVDHAPIRRQPPAVTDIAWATAVARQLKLELDT